MKSVDKVRRWRAKKAKQGGRNLSVWLEPDTAKMLDEVRTQQPDTKLKDIVKAAIEQLHNVTCNPVEPLKPKRKRRPLSEVFDEVIANSRDGVPLKKYRPALKRFCKHELTTGGRSYGDVARYFNSISLRTFDGRKWKVVDVKGLVES